VQQTKANGDLVLSSQRAAEYDAMGRTIAEPGPYITLDTLPPDDGGGGILIGSGEGYRPGRNTYKVDGLPVPESDFMMMLESGWIGGMFGLLEMTARMSAREVLGYTVTTSDGDLRVVHGFSNRSDALDFAARVGVNRVDRWIQVNNWQVIGSLIPQAQRQTQDDLKKLQTQLSHAPRQKHPNKDRLRDDYNARMKINNGDGSCLEKLNALLKELGIEDPSIEKLATNYLDGRFGLHETTEPVLHLRQKIKGVWTRVDAPEGATAFNGRSNEITLNKADSHQGFTFIHELLHAAARGRTFGHREINDAIRALEGRVDVSENSFIGKYCQEKKKTND